MVATRYFRATTGLRYYALAVAPLAALVVAFLITLSGSVHAMKI